MSQPDWFQTSEYNNAEDSRSQEMQRPLRPSLPRSGIIRFQKTEDRVDVKPLLSINHAGVAARVLGPEEGFALVAPSSLKRFDKAEKRVSRAAALVRMVSNGTDVLRARYRSQVYLDGKGTLPPTANEQARWHKRRRGKQTKVFLEFVRGLPLIRKCLRKKGKKMAPDFGDE